MATSTQCLVQEEAQTVAQAGQGGLAVAQEAVIETRFDAMRLSFPPL